MFSILCDRIDEIYKSLTCDFRAVIMFLIEEVNRNVYDQRYVEHAIYRQCASVTVIRRTYRHLVERAHLQDGKLIMYVIHASSLS